MNWRKWLKRSPLILIGLLVVIQAVPYGRAHDNPPVLAEPQWDSAATRQLAVAACYDCHSNEVVWPWYTNIAPISWLATHDVDEGRGKLNFSEWNTGEQETDELGEVIESGEMPPIYYGWIHPAARLTDSEMQQLITGLEASVGGRRG
ncbi:MAG: heme-binding domain-containing protein [Acidimicrobiia bacterium]|nr:heme-binding domain-containing protein [Acidimicrobiia bacterium]